MEESMVEKKTPAETRKKTSHLFGFGRISVVLEPMVLFIRLFFVGYIE
jgi:hypothetical protein